MADRTCPVCGEEVPQKEMVTRDGVIMCLACAEKKDEEADGTQ